MAVILDAGALIAYERLDRTVVAFLELAQQDRTPVRTTSPAVAQAWRSGARQARLARLLRGTDERPLDAPAARRVGELLGAAGFADVVDASLIDACAPGDEVLTSDPGDLVRLAEAAGKALVIIPLGD